MTSDTRSGFQKHSLTIGYGDFEQPSRPSWLAWLMQIFTCSPAGYSVQHTYLVLGFSGIFSGKRTFTSTAALFYESKNGVGRLLRRASLGQRLVEVEKRAVCHLREWVRLSKFIFRRQIAQMSQFDF